MQDPKTHLWGYVGADSKWVIAPKFKAVEPFVGEWAEIAVPVKGSVLQRYGVIDRNGHEVVAPQGFRRIAFGEGLAVVPTTDKADEFKYVNAAGKPAFPLTFRYGSPFSEGLAWAMTTDYLRGYMNRDGKFVILNARMEEVGEPFSEKRAVINRNDNTFHVIDTSGADLFNARGSAGKFSEDMLRFTLGEGQWGFYDRTGKLVVPPTLLAAEDFHDGRAAVQDKNGLGYIGRTGEIVIPTGLTRADDFADGVAIAGRDGMVGMIDRAGKWLVDPIFADADTLLAGHALMTQWVTPTEKRTRLVASSDTLTLNPRDVKVPPELLAILSSDVEGLPRAFAGLDKLTADQKSKLQAAFAAIDTKKFVEGVLALETLRKQKVPAAAVVLGRLYQLGIGVTEDPRQAAACYLDAAVAKDAFAIFEYGRLRYAGPPGVRNLPDALSAFQMAAEAGDRAALRYLAYLLLDGKLLEVNPELALAYAYRSAKAGDARAGLAVGFCLETGFGAKTDVAAALAAYQAVGNAGDVDGMTNAGRLEEKAGHREAAIEWYRKAAKQDPAAAERLTALQAATQPAP
jgi:TPR repeat protein